MPLPPDLAFGAKLPSSTFNNVKNAIRAWLEDVSAEGHKIHSLGSLQINPAALPEEPTAGQLAVDNADGKLKVYDGAEWKAAGGAGSFAEIAGDPADNAALDSALAGKAPWQPISPGLDNLNATDNPNGTYYFGDATTGDKPFNYGHIIVARETVSDGIVQIATGLIDGQMAFRRYIGSEGGWQAWLALSLVGHNHSALAITTDTLGWARLPLPTPSTVGAVKRNAGTSGQFVTGIDSGGNLTYGTPPSGTLEIEDAGGAVGTQPKLRFIVASGVTQAVTEDDGAIEVLTGMDTAVTATRAQVQSGADLLVAPASGSDSAYVASMSPALDAYTDGMVVHFRPDVSNSGACTLNIDGQGAVDILQSDGTTDPVSGDLVAGRQYALYYAAAIPAFVMPPAGGGAPPSVGFGDLTGDPADNSALDGALAGKANSSHTHSAADITSGTLDVEHLPNVMSTAGEGYWFPVSRTRNTTAGSWTALRTYVHKAIAPYGMTLRRVLAYTTGFGASQGFTAGIYSSSGALLASASVGNVSAGAVMHELTLSSAVTLLAGQVVWIAIATDGSGSFGIVNDSAAFPGSAFGATILIGYGTASTGSNGSIALPTPLGTVTNAGGSPIWTMFLP